MKIVQLANFYGPESGGIRTALDAVGRGYTEAGHERVLIVPGPADADEATTAGRRLTLKGRRLPHSGGYRVLTDRVRVRRLLEELRPDRLEVSDKLTLRALGSWARQREVPSVVISHERFDALLALRVPGWFPVASVADRANRRLAAAFDQVVCASAYALSEFARVRAGNVVRVPLGVDLTAFSPDRRSFDLRAALGGVREVLLVCVGRLATEKKPELAVEAVRSLVDRGVGVRLVMAGDGPRRPAIEARAAGLPVTVLGHVSDRAYLAKLLASADAVLCPCPVESFGLAALEALASGTPVVAVDSGAIPELLSPGAGVAARPRGSAFAAAVTAVLDWDLDRRRRAARARAEEFPWAATIDKMLAVHSPVPAPARA